SRVTSWFRPQPDATGVELHTFGRAGRAVAWHNLAGVPAGPQQDLTNNFSPLNGDDLLTEIIGGPQLSDQIDDLLRANGFNRRDSAELSGWATDLSQLEAMQIRGPSASRPTLVVKGTLTDRHVTVRMEAFPINVRTVGQPFEFLKMDVAEGGP